MSDRPKRPLNPAAVSAADDEVYQNHADDPRPNALYDADGNRKPLDNSAGQADLRKEWMDSYKANGGEMDSTPASNSAADQPVQPCDDRPVVNPLISAEAGSLDDSGTEAGESSE